LPRPTAINTRAEMMVISALKYWKKMVLTTQRNEPAG
jgi:hypothetical protein